MKKRILTASVSAMVTVASVITLGSSLLEKTDVFVMPATEEIAQNNAMPIESAKTVQGKPTKVEVQSGNVVVCESLVQGIRDCNLANGTYTFKVTRKSRKYNSNNFIQSRINKLLR